MIVAENKQINWSCKGWRDNKKYASACRDAAAKKYVHHGINAGSGVLNQREEHTKKH